MGRPRAPISGPELLKVCSVGEPVAHGEMPESAERLATLAVWRPRKSWAHGIAIARDKTTVSGLRKSLSAALSTLMIDKIRSGHGTWAKDKRAEIQLGEQSSRIP